MSLFSIPAPTYKSLTFRFILSARSSVIDEMAPVVSSGSDILVNVSVTFALVVRSDGSTRTVNLIV